MRLLTRTCDAERMNLARLAARLFVAAGGLFWAVAAFSANYGYRDTGLFAGAGDVLVPIVITVGVFVLGLFYEYLAAAVLGAGVAGAVIWGILFGWEAGVWATTVVFLVLPMLVAAVLYLLAAQTQDACEMEASRGGAVHTA